MSTEQGDFDRDQYFQAHPDSLLIDAIEPLPDGGARVKIHLSRGAYDVMRRTASSQQRQWGKGFDVRHAVMEGLRVEQLLARGDLFIKEGRGFARKFYKLISA